MGSAEELDTVESDFILLDVGVQKDVTLQLVLNAVAHKVIVKEELLTKYISKVSLSKELVDVGLVQPYQLVLDILQNGSHGGQGEDIAAFLLLDSLVGNLVLGQVGERNFRLEFDSRAIDHCLADGSAELAQNIIAGVDDEG